MSLRPPFFTLLLCSSLACTLPPYDPQASATAAATDTIDTTTTTSTSDSPTLPSPTTGSTTTGSTSDGCSFLECDTGTPPDNECDIWKEDCPEGQKCMPYANDGSSAWNALKCSPLDPDPAQAGEPCTVEGSAVSGVDSCDKHAMCWEVDTETGMGECVPMCIGTPDAPSCADPLRSCIMANEGVLILCLPQCDPIAQDCPNQDLCIPNPQDPARFFCVLAAGEAYDPLEPCEFANACDSGLHCADPALAIECNPNATGCCLPFCDLDEPNTCPGQGQQCVPWYEDPSEAASFNTDVGACALPMP